MIADKNLAPSLRAEADLRWILPSSEGVLVEGFPWSGGDPATWMRLPETVWHSREISDPLRHVAAQPAGGVIRLVSDSEVVGIRCDYGRVEESRQTPGAATKGFDVYVNGSIFCGNLAPEGSVRSFESSLRLPATVCQDHASPREVTIYLPLQLPLEHLEIGLESRSEISAPNRKTSRVVFYGSSITQGFCASRPGLTYPARVCRALGAEMVNLGFGGNCRGELVVARAIAQLRMDALVYDYDHNAEGAEELTERHAAFLHEILAVQPRLPVLVLSSPNFHNDPAYFARRHSVIAATCHKARLEGYKVDFLKGETFWAADDECTVDRLHPNDAGFTRMAERVLSALSGLLC